MLQLITPTPDIPCRPGWCLQYVRQAFGLPARYASATEAWNNSTTQHPGRDFPPGAWVPVWYAVNGEPLGHVVILAPDGSVYSTSDLTNTPHHHPDLADLEAYYARYGMALTYRGWTEDIAGYPVLIPDPGAALAAAAATINALTEQNGDVILLAALSDTEQRELLGNTRTIIAMLTNMASWMNTAGRETQVNVQRIRTDQVAPGTAEQQ